MKTFTRKELILHVGKHHSQVINDETVISYINRLLKGGFLEVSKRAFNNPKAFNVYTLIKNTGVETPRLTKDGQPSKQGLGRENLWRSIRTLGEFNYRELAVTASTEKVSVSDTQAQDYVKHLKKAGYLQETQAASPSGVLARYRLAPRKNTGPRPPQIQRIKQVYDPNLGEIVWPITPSEDE